MTVWKLGSLILLWLPLALCQCKYVPTDAEWPSKEEWSRFNSSIDGKLIETIPVALPCYAGTAQSASACQTVTDDWTSSAFQASQPLGYSYAVNDSCPLTPFGADTNSSACSLGNDSVYAVNATTEKDIIQGVKFAKRKNLRVVIKSTGHDFLQRSAGLGSLMIWLYHFRDGYEFLDSCETPGCNWNGSTLTIAGSYAWSDIYPTAKEKGVIVVGGNNAGPCSTGGWTQGGGHSPVTHYYGLGADQVLSARVVLASGDIVTASPVENRDLFFAIRGGGGGTYGILTQIVVKTYPTTNVNVVDISIGSTANETGRFLDAVTLMYTALPSLSQAGLAGYGEWAAHLPTPNKNKNYTNIYDQTLTSLGVSLEETTTSVRHLVEQLRSLNQSLDIAIVYSEYPDYGSYFANKSGTVAAVGAATALASRLLDTAALTINKTRLRSALETMSGTQGKPVYHTLVHHGLEARHKWRTDKPGASAVQPGWYRSIVLDIFERVMNGTYVDANIETFNDLRENLVPVYKNLAPDTGTYMNEADWGDADWQKDFYGANWQRITQVKAKYDPEGIFYCPTCVGSEGWVVGGKGELCRST